VNTPPREMLEEHHAVVAGDRPWQRRLRLLQSIWREEQGLAPGTHPRGAADGRLLGSRLALPAAERDLSNYLTDAIKQVVREELDSPATRDEGKLFSEPRIYDDLLSSQPLCFNLFAELKADLDRATALGRHLWPDRVDRVTRIEFEHSPGRDDETYLGNRTAFEAYLEHTTPDGGEGFVAIEVKYHESLEVSAAENRDRISQVARASDSFDDASLTALRTPPLQRQRPVRVPPPRCQRGELPGREPLRAAPPRPVDLPAAHPRGRGGSAAHRRRSPVGRDVPRPLPGVRQDS
jgi:hypothetical protein